MPFFADMKNRIRRNEIKAKKTGYYHLCSDGLKDRKLFNDAAEFAYAMLLIGIITLKFGVTIYAFTLMPNHFHIVLKGSGADVLRAFDFLCRNISARLVRDGYPPLGDYNCIVVDIEDERQMRQAIAYVHRNAYEKGFASPDTYMWSSGWLYFSDVPKMVSGVPYGAMSYREKRDILQSKQRIPSRWLFNKAIGLLPICFVDTSMSDKVFRDVKTYQTAMIKDYEAYVKIAREVGENTMFSKEEISDIIEQNLQEDYAGKNLSALTQDEKCRLAITLNREYQLTPRQISTSIFLKEHIILQVLNAKEYRI